MLVSLCGGKGAGQVRCGGNGGALITLIGPPFKMIGLGDLLLLSGLLEFEDFPLVIVADGGGGGVIVQPERNWSLNVETLLVEDEFEGDCTGGDIDDDVEIVVIVVIDDEEMSTVLTALIGAVVDVLA